jgi:pimeloyl-ACP methyl ester carboxylesterase
MEGHSVVDVPPDDMRWGHAFGPGAGGVELHYVLHGRGAPVLLLHGWPGFWYDWRHIIPRLAHEASLIAPDFRGFGDSDRPDLQPSEGYTPEVFARDLLALLNHLGVAQVVVAAHDIGATVAQVLARTAPDRVRALALFNPPYPGVGMRRFDPAVQGEFWYQHFHALPWAGQLVGYELGTVELYLGHFYDHWVGRKETVRPAELEWITGVYARPDAVRTSLLYYRARAETRLQEAQADPRTLRVTQPTVVVWGESDPVMRAEWSDRLAEYFSLVSLELLPGVGHFVPFEAPDAAAAAIRAAMATRVP